MTLFVAFILYILSGKTGLFLHINPRLKFLPKPDDIYIRGAKFPAARPLRSLPKKIKGA
jgi:hypothetical protein